MSHDPDKKIAMARGTKFKNVLTKTCLYKSYPQEGKFHVESILYPLTLPYT